MIVNGTRLAFQLMVFNCIIIHISNELASSQPYEKLEKRTKDPIFEHFWNKNGNFDKKANKITAKMVK